MSDGSVKEQAPTREELEREARRLERSRHLTLVGGTETDDQLAPVVALHDPDPDPQAAA
jgi:hypothetical protein